MTEFFRAAYSLMRTKVCRHCGKTFRTSTPAQKTCKRPSCVAWSKELLIQQRKKAKLRWLARQHMNKETNK